MPTVRTNETHCALTSNLCQKTHSDVCISPRDLCRRSASWDSWTSTRNFGPAKPKPEASGQHSQRGRRKWPGPVVCVVEHHTLLSLACVPRVPVMPHVPGNVTAHFAHLTGVANCYLLRACAVPLCGWPPLAACYLLAGPPLASRHAGIHSQYLTVTREHEAAPRGAVRTDIHVLAL